eukprot:gene31959-38642_t
MFSDDIQWTNGYLADNNQPKEELKSFLAFFEDPRVTVFDLQEMSPPQGGSEGRQVQVRYQLSFSYPLPWRPRIVIPGNATIRFSAALRVERVEEHWEGALGGWARLLASLPPRLWDLWHVFPTRAPEVQR